jgi:hypothetical protein
MQIVEFLMTLKCSEWAQNHGVCVCLKKQYITRELRPLGPPVVLMRLLTVGDTEKIDSSE